MTDFNIYFDDPDTGQMDKFPLDDEMGFNDELDIDEFLEPQFEFTLTQTKSNITQNSDSNSNSCVQSNETHQTLQLTPFETTSNLSSQHCITHALFDNNSNPDYIDNITFGPTLVGHKRKLKLSTLASVFKSDFYSIFTNKKKFPKTFVKKIHQLIERPLNLEPFTREITRFNDLYFITFAPRYSEIIPYLYANKQYILQKIPELNSY